MSIVRFQDVCWVEIGAIYKVIFSFVPQLDQLILLPSISDAEVNMDDKSAVKVKGLWDEWHMRQIVEQPSRVNHRSGNNHTTFLIGNIQSSMKTLKSCVVHEG